jgi:hypothetical protein
MKKLVLLTEMVAHQCGWNPGLCGDIADRHSVIATLCKQPLRC